MGLLDNKVAIITGAGGGLGRAYALAFAKEGCKVVVNDLGGSRDGQGGSSSMADQVVAEIKALGGDAVANYASVADPDGAKSLTDDALKAWGRLDIVLNNAGILRDKTLLKLEDENFDIVMAVHARGTYLVTKHAAKAMVDLGHGGSIINTTSIAALRGNFGQTNYACAKGGIWAMTNVWHQELGRAGIRVNAIGPVAKTRMTEDISAVPDDSTPEQVASFGLFLASDLSKEVTGRTFGVHGRHVFEYHMKMSPGVEKPGADWTPVEFAQKLGQISALPSDAAPAAAPAAASASPAELCDEVFKRMPALFMPERAADWSSVLHFDIVGTGSWTVSVSGGACTTAKGKPDAAKCTITYDSADTLLGTVSGKTNAQQAFMGGKIKADNMGDLMKFAQCFDMKKAAEMAKAEAKAAAAGPAKEMSVGDAVNEVFVRMPSLFMPDRAAGWASVLHFDIVGTGSWTVTVADGQCTAAKGKPDAAKCTITYDSADTLLGTVTGKTNAQQAFMGGKIKADNMGDLMKFAQCFDMKKAAEAAKAEAAKGGAPAAAEKPDGLNYALVGKTYRGPAGFVRKEHTVQYAQATNDLNAAYVGDGDVVAPLLFPVRYFHQLMGETVVDPELNADLLRLVHGEQDMRFFDVVKPMDLVAARATLYSIEEKSSGELLQVRLRLMRDGETVCEAISGVFIRAKKKAEKPAEKPAAEPAPARTLLFESTYPVDKDQPIRYAAVSLDNNPIHVDDNTARAAGHPGVILHGLCTMAMTCRELVDRACGGDPRRLKRLRVRFTKPVLPGDTLTTRAWAVETNGGVTTLGVETVNQKGETVIGNGLAEVAG